MNEGNNTPWLTDDLRGSWLPPEHLYSNPPSRGPRGARIPSIDIDKLQLIMYKFFDLCETNELTASLKKVEKEIQALFAWSQVSPKIWTNFFDRTKREHKESYTFPEFFAIYLAVESGEFLSTSDPDPYKEPEKWMRREDGTLIARPINYEAVLLSPKNQGKPLTFQRCLGCLFHHFGLDNPRLLMCRLQKSGKPILCSFSDFFPSDETKMVHRSKSRLEDAMHSRSDCASPEPPSRNSQVHISDQVLVERKISSPNYESLRKRMISPSNMHTLFNHNSKPKTAYHTEEGTVESWDIQYRCRRALKRGGIVDDELQKIFVFYFPFTVSKGFERSHGNLSQPNSDLQARGCRLEEYWKFWKDVGFFEGPYRDSPPFFINKSFAVGCGMQELFLDFSAENSCGRQLKMKGAAVELSLEGWCRALREMGQLVLGHVARDPRAASERFIYEVVLPNCRRDKPNPVLTHFKRAEVSALLERYRTPLLRLFEHLCGTAPNVFAMLTPDAAPARGAPQPQPDAVRSQASEEAETDGGASGKGSRSAGQGIEEHGMRAGEAACGSAARMNVEEFLLFCRTMDLCPALVSELSLRYRAAHRPRMPPAALRRPSQIV